MARILINLLPPEILALKKKNSKFYKIQLIGTIIVSIVIFLTSLVIALRIIQSRKLADVQNNNKQAEQKIADLKNTQTTLFILKDRLKVITEYWSVSSKQSTMYELINKLIPTAVTVNAITIDKEGEGSLLALVPDNTTLDSLINNLTSKELNEGKISQVSVENLSLGKEGLFRVNLKIKP